MKRALLTLVAIVITCGWALAQEQSAGPPEQLQCYEQLVGNWLFEGEMQDEVPGMPAKGTKLVWRASWQWIVDRQALESSYMLRAEGAPRIAGRGLITWDPAASRIVSGEVSSMGGYSLSAVTYDAQNKTWTEQAQGVDKQGRSITWTAVTKLVDADTVTWQITEQAGGDVTGPGSVYTLKRDFQARKPRSFRKEAVTPAEDDKK